MRTNSQFNIQDSGVFGAYGFGLLGFRFVLKRLLLYSKRVKGHMGSGFLHIVCVVWALQFMPVHVCLRGVEKAMSSYVRKFCPGCLPGFVLFLIRWWGTATLTTVGYGDIYPITPFGKMLGGVVAFCGVLLFGLPAGIISAGFAEVFGEKEQRPSRALGFC